MRVLTASDRALLVETADLDEAMRLHAALRRALVSGGDAAEGAAPGRARGALAGIVELVPGARTVLVRFDPARTRVERLVEGLVSMEMEAEAEIASIERTIPVRYDGEDLDDVAGLLGLSSVEEVAARHLAAHWRVGFVGFSPGFAYLVSDDPLFVVPRRASPRTRVPMGAVALAGAFTGVYPRESPGGWQLIGRTDAAMWDLSRDPPALLTPGARVRFARAPRESVRAAPVAPPAREATEAVTEAAVDGPRIEIVRGLLPVLVQDLGRPGQAALAVSASGAADRTALRDANRAVGNAASAAVLEIVGEAVLRFHGAGAAAVTGAVGELVLAAATGAEHPMVHGTPFAVADGDELWLGAPSRGLRIVVGVRGGVLAAPVLGSLATDTLAGLGPSPLRVGDAVGVGTTAPSAVQPEPLPRELPAPGETVELAITLGPREDWFTDAAIRALLGQEWEVTPRSDRIGLRLHGAVPLERAIAGELPSEGAVTGAIQVPADGQPVLFLPDHPLTGGYPIIGAVVDRDLDLVGQLPPGARIRFRATGP